MINNQNQYLDSCFFLIYIHDLSQKLKSQVKPFADDNSLFSITNCMNFLTSTLNRDLFKWQNWDYWWKLPLDSNQTIKQRRLLSLERQIKPHIHDSLSPTLNLSSIQVKSTCNLFLIINWQNDTKMVKFIKHIKMLVFLVKLQPFYHTLAYWLFITHL